VDVAHVRHQGHSKSVTLLRGTVVQIGTFQGGHGSRRELLKFRWRHLHLGKMPAPAIGPNDEWLKGHRSTLCLTVIDLFTGRSCSATRAANSASVASGCAAESATRRSSRAVSVRHRNFVWFRRFESGSRECIVADTEGGLWLLRLRFLYLPSRGPISLHSLRHCCFLRG
jgi:hypothetical protein